MSSWKCRDCGLSNNSESSNCQACFGTDLIDAIQGLNLCPNKKKEDTSNSADLQQIQDNEKFDSSKLKLIVKPHRPKLILCFHFRDYDYKNGLFYDQLSTKNREEVNEIMYKFWDKSKYKPITMDTNGGDRYTDGFHCKLQYDDESYSKLLQENGIKHKFIQHFQKVSFQYKEIHERIENDQYQEDLSIYINQYKRDQNQLEWFPKIDDPKTTELCDDDINNICRNDILFDDDMRTVLYLEYDTKENSKTFKMINHQNTLNEMINNILNVIKMLQQKTFSERADRDYSNVLKWFSFNFTAKPKMNKQNNNPMIIRVELHITIVNYLYFMYIYQNQKHESIQEWFIKYKNKYKSTDKFARRYTPDKCRLRCRDEELTI